LKYSEPRERADYSTNGGGRSIGPHYLRLQKKKGDFQGEIVLTHVCLALISKIVWEEETGPNRDSRQWGRGCCCSARGPKTGLNLIIKNGTALLGTSFFPRRGQARRKGRVLRVARRKIDSRKDQLWKSGAMILRD